ncbi:MAG: Rrf2 family transcriptional regulator [Chthonomonadaceae bacterium]|nr:Rrf2 family transcriptional regulator [Chthonomonadaceae bacterium]
MISSRGKYATRALLHLAQREGQAPVSIQEISERQVIPLKFLEQILLTLKQAGFVTSRKGPGGGYQLAKSATKISLGEVVRVFEGPLALVSCASVTRFGECGCPHPEVCGLREVWIEARHALAQVLDLTTFADIVQRQSHLEAGHHAIHDFSI